MVGLYCLFPDFRSSKRAERTAGRDCAVDIKWSPVFDPDDAALYAAQIRANGGQNRVFDGWALVPIGGSVESDPACLGGLPHNGIVFLDPSGCLRWPAVPSRRQTF